MENSKFTAKSSLKYNSKFNFNLKLVVTSDKYGSGDSLTWKYHKKIFTFLVIFYYESI